MVKKIIIFVLMGLTGFILFLSSVGHSFAQDETQVETMLLANQLYERGNFSEAARTYDEVVRGGIQDHVLYYNLGNAYFKQGDMGRALLNYERASRLAPRDEDVRSNLASVREQRIDQYEHVEPSLLTQITTFTQAWLTSNEMALISLSLWLFFTLALLLYWNLNVGTLRNGLQSVLLFAFLLLSMSLLLLGNRYYVEQDTPKVVVIVDEVEVLNHPSEDGVAEFTLHSGAELYLTETRGGRAHVMLTSDELQGWVPVRSVERILLTSRP